MEHLIEAVDGTLLALLIVLATLLSVVGVAAFVIGRAVSNLADWMRAEGADLWR
jgi:hypothetical protein